MFVPELGPPNAAPIGNEFSYGMPAETHGSIFAEPVFWIAALLIVWAGLVHIGFGISVNAGAGD